MKQINSLADAQKVINQILDWKAKLESKDWDFHQLRITNAGEAVNDNDYVIKSQLPTIGPSGTVANQDFTVVWSNDGVPGVGDNFPEYVFGKDRVGYPTAVWIRSKVSPVGGPFTVQLFKNGSNIMNVDISIPASQSGPIFSSDFVQPVPSFGFKDILGGQVTAINNGSVCSVGVCIRRTF